jgi:hypothetical protein
MSWSEKYKRSIDCDNPKGFSQRAHCDGRKKRNVSEDLRRWFSKTAPEGNWKRYNTKGEAIGPCAREPGEPKPKCLSNEKAAKMTKLQRAAAVRRKRKSDPVANRKGKGGKPIMVSNRIGEQMDMIRYCPKCKKNETQKECAFGPKFWALYSSPPMLTTNQMKYDIAQVHPANESKEPDHEHSMARAQLSKMDSAVKRLRKKLKGEGNIEAWVQSKITKASDYIDAAADYLDSGEHNVGEEYIAEKNVPTNPSLWSRMKSRAKAKFDVYPSAYANGWAAKEYKKAGGGWKSVTEDVTIQDANGNDFIQFIDIVGTQEIYSNWKKEIGLIGEAIDKAKMKCNSPKAQSHGSGEQGKSHVVKACEGGEEKIIRFGQLGVKGSPKKKGESKAYASRRKRFQTRHAKNIAKGKMSAAYWADKVKW